MNPMVSPIEVKKFWVRFLDLNNSKELYKTATLTNVGEKDYSYTAFALGYIDFNVNDFADLQQGMYYKIQLAYSDNADIEEDLDSIFLTWSTVGVTKCCGVGQISIDGLLINGTTQVPIKNYRARYSNTDLAEGIYSYEFVVVNQDTEEIIATSGVQLHNNINDTVELNNNEEAIKYSIDDFMLNKMLLASVEYTIQYKAITVNGLRIESPLYHITAGDGDLDSAFSADLEVIVSPDNNNGLINLTIQGVNEKEQFGMFKLLRASELDNYSTWEEMTSFNVNNVNIGTILVYKDWFVEHYVNYKYALLEYNLAGTTSNLFAMTETPVKVDFEDIFLSDGSYQLRIQFNPKVSSFKNVVQESKLETLGGQFPFFFRNGNIKYKEIPISGLISYLEDENNLFIKYSDLGINKEDTNASPTVNLVGYNFKAERDFKLKVLDWLNNGQPKQFRSPAEGNYIIRLMNVSLSPTEGLSRLTHTFSATGYEMAEYNMDNLRSLGMVK